MDTLGAFEAEECVEFCCQGGMAWWRGARWGVWDGKFGVGGERQVAEEGACCCVGGARGFGGVGGGVEEGEVDFFFCCLGLGLLGTWGRAGGAEDGA